MTLVTYAFMKNMWCRSVRIASQATIYNGKLVHKHEVPRPDSPGMSKAMCRCEVFLSHVEFVTSTIRICKQQSWPRWLRRDEHGHASDTMIDRCPPFSPTSTNSQALHLVFLQHHFPVSASNSRNVCIASFALQLTTSPSWNAFVVVS